MGKIITDLEQVTPAWLTELMREKNYLTQGKVSQVVKRALLNRAVCPLEVTYLTDMATPPPNRLALKFSKQKYSAELAAILGKKEVEFYNLLAPSLTTPPIVRCYEAVLDLEVGAYHLLLDDHSRTHYTPSSLETPFTKLEAEQTLDCLAYLHGTFWEDARIGKTIGQLPTEESTKRFVAHNQANQTGFLDFTAERFSPNDRKIFEKVLSVFPDLLLKRLQAGKAVTLVHGDSYPGNFLFPYNPKQYKIYLFDWQQWEVSAAAFDVAYLMSFLTYPQNQNRQGLEQELLKRYHQQLLAQGVTNYDWQNFWYDYRLFTIRNLFRPFWGYTNKLWGPNRWIQLEKALTAFNELDCMEILEPV